MASNPRVVSESDLADVKLLAAQLRALAEPNRLQIVRLLQHGERCVCEIETTVGLSQSLVSNHLRVLRRVGLVTARRDAADARWIYYRLNPDVVEKLRIHLTRLLDVGQLDRGTVHCTANGTPIRRG